MIVLDFVGAPEPINRECTERFRDHVIRSQKYQVLPQWYVNEKMDPLLSHQQVLDLFSASYLLQGKITEKQGIHTLNVIAIEQLNGEHPIIFADFVRGTLEQFPHICQELANRFLGQWQPLPFKSPGFAAGLSLIVPGGGHFYLQEPIHFAIGTAFTLAYLSVAYMALADEHTLVSREQWGAILLMINLTDILTAYFLTQQYIETHRHNE